MRSEIQLQRQLKLSLAAGRADHSQPSTAELCGGAKKCVLATLLASFRSSVALEFEVFALRHQLGALLIYGRFEFPLSLPRNNITLAIARATVPARDDPARGGLRSS